MFICNYFLYICFSNAECFNILYSVTQKYTNSFLGYVVLDTFSNVSRDENSILDQIYIKQICPDFYYDDFLFS